MLKKNMLWILLLLTLTACIYLAQQEDSANSDDDIVVLTTPGYRRVNGIESNKKQTESIQASPQLLRPQLTDEPTNIFTAYIPQAELNQKKNEIPVVDAPANPFIFAGKLVDNGNIIVFLMDAKANYSVVTGDILAEVWQVRSIAPPMMTIRYLPLKIDMQLQIGALS